MSNSMIETWKIHLKKQTRPIKRTDLIQIMVSQIVLCGGKTKHTEIFVLTFPSTILVLGFNMDSFLAAFSMALAAPSNSFSAIQLGSEGLTQSSSLSCSAAVANSVTHWAILREMLPNCWFESIAPGLLRLCMTNCNSSRYCIADSRPAFSALLRTSSFSEP